MNEKTESKQPAEQTKAVAPIPEKKDTVDIVKDFFCHPLVTGGLGTVIGYYLGKSNQDTSNKVNDFYQSQIDRLRDKLKSAEKTIDRLNEENRNLRLELSGVKLRHDLEQQIRKPPTPAKTPELSVPENPLRYLKNEKHEFNKKPDKSYIKMVID